MKSSIQICVVMFTAAFLPGHESGAANLPSQQAYVKASNTRAGNAFGNDVAISGDTLVVGSVAESSGATGVNGDQADQSAFRAGAAYVFVRTTTGWSQEAYLKASNTGAEDHFGARVAVWGDTIAVSAPWEGSDATGVGGDQSNDRAPHAGAVYVFVRTGTSWAQQAYLKASNAGADDQFGVAIALSGNTLVVGAAWESSDAVGVNGAGDNNSRPASGAAYVFVREGTNWVQQAYLKASNPDAEDHFGLSVGVSGDTVVIGAPDEDSAATGVNGNQASNGATNSGAAYVFVRRETNWEQQAYLKASNTGGANNAFGSIRPGDAFGGLHGVSISGDTIVVGAAQEASSSTRINGDENNNFAPGAGAAYVFVRRGTLWSQEAYLKASNAQGNDGFGAVAVAGDTVVVGAFLEDSNATGVNGDEASNTGTNSGAAYVFWRNGTNWFQVAYLKPSNTRPMGFFGESVAASGETVAVGSSSESSNATGVDGNQSDTSAPGAGAAYVFTGLGIGPHLQLSSLGQDNTLIKLNGVPDVSYRLERSDSPSGPWQRIAISNAPASGQLKFEDHESGPGQAFYRTAQ